MSDFDFSRKPMMVQSTEVKFCRHRPGGSVYCTRERCHGCGWHPVVEERRKQMVRKRLLGGAV